MLVDPLNYTTDSAMLSCESEAFIHTVNSSAAHWVCVYGRAQLEGSCELVWSPEMFYLLFNALTNLT